MQATRSQQGNSNRSLQEDGVRNGNESDPAPTKYEPHSVTFAATNSSCADRQQPSELKATKRAESGERFDFSKLSRIMITIDRLCRCKRGSCSWSVKDGFSSL